MITVHDKELCRELLGFEVAAVAGGNSCCHKESKCNETKTTTHRSPQESHSSQTSLLRSNTHSQLIRAQDWLSRKARRAVIALPSDPDAQKVESMCTRLENERQQLFDEIDQFLTTQAQYKQCKKEMLYQKWKDQVFDPLSSSIRTTFNSTYSFNDMLRRQLFDQYLKLKNKKGVFLETISPLEYNPLRMTYTAPIAEVPILNDPLLSPQKDHQNEIAVMHNCDVGVSPVKSHDIKTTPPGRSDTDPLLWLAMKIIQINSDERYRNRQGIKDLQSLSRLNAGSGIVKDKGEENEREPYLPHKTPIHYPREKISLEWDNNHSTTEEDDNNK